LVCAVCQGGILSPYLFAVFVDSILEKLKLSNLGCHIKTLCFSPIMYADDLILISLSVTELQHMVDLCIQILTDLVMKVNVKKSACMRIGPLYKTVCHNITVENNEVEWKSELRFLGIFLYSAKNVSVNFQTVKQKYFRALNGIFAKVGTQASAMVLCSLINPFCLPILCYGLESFNMTQSGYNSLESAFSTAFFKMFGISDKSTLRHCQFYCNVLPMSYMLDLRKINFMTSISKCHNETVKFLYDYSGKLELNTLNVKYNIMPISAISLKRQFWHYFNDSVWK